MRKVLALLSFLGFSGLSLSLIFDLTWLESFNQLFLMPTIVKIPFNLRPLILILMVGQIMILFYKKERGRALGILWDYFSGGAVLICFKIIIANQVHGFPDTAIFFITLFLLNLKQQLIPKLFCPLILLAGFIFLSQGITATDLLGGFTLAFMWQTLVYQELKTIKAFHH